jgi:hypothetical protein
MRTYTTAASANTGTFQNDAGEYVYKNGPTAEDALLSAVESPMPSYRKAESLQRAIQSGWLSVAQNGHIECTPLARAHYDEMGGKVPVKYIGQMAAPRLAVNAFERPPLSKKHLPNSRGTRQDVPDWSVRPAGFGFKSIGGSLVIPMRFPGKEEK